MSYQFQAPGPAPQQHPLDYWLASGMAGMSGTAQDSLPSALRDMAWNRGQLLGLGAACTGTGAAMAGASLLVLLLDGAAVASVIFLCLAAVLLGSAVAVRGLLRRPPKVTPMMQSRAPGKFSSGLGFAAFMSVVFGVGLFPVVGPLLREGPLQLLGFVAAYALMLLVTGSLFAAPAYFSQNARRLFRQQISKDPGLRRFLEEMALTWRDPRGARQFGPL